MQKVLLIANDEGNVVDVVDVLTGAPILFDFKTGEDESDELRENVHACCTRANLPPRIVRALNASVKQTAAHTIPLPHVDETDWGLTGCVFLLRSRDKPSDTGDPITLGYGKGVSLVEVRTKMEDGAFLSKALVQTPEFQQRLMDAEASLRTPSGAPPGLFMPDTNALRTLARTCTSPDYPNDPLLKTYNPFYLKEWAPHLAENDFVRMYTSDWANVHDTTCTSFGHSRGDLRFYIVIRWDLPPEITDQLLQLVSVNPDKETWKELSERKEFKRALDISIAVRENIAERFAKHMGLSLRHSDRKFVHTTSDILVPNAQACVPGTDGEKRAAVAMYNACAPTHLAPGGVVTLTMADPREPVFWWHGPPTPENPGRGASPP